MQAHSVSNFIALYSNPASSSSHRRLAAISVLSGRPREPSSDDQRSEPVGLPQHLPRHSNRKGGCPLRMRQQIPKLNGSARQIDELRLKNAVGPGSVHHAPEWRLACHIRKQEVERGLKSLKSDESCHNHELVVIPRVCKETPGRSQQGNGSLLGPCRGNEVRPLLGQPLQMIEGHHFYLATRRDVAHEVLPARVG